MTADFEYAGIYNVTCVLWAKRSKVRMRVTCNEDGLKRVLFDSNVCAFAYRRVYGRGPVGGCRMFWVHAKGCMFREYKVCELRLC